MEPIPPQLTHPVVEHAWHEVRVAPLVQQGRRRDGALEFVALLAILVITCAGALAFVRGKPIAAPAPAPAPIVAPATPAGS